MTASLAGFAFGIALIAAVGAQNVFVLRQGLRVEHVAAVVAICSLSDIVIIGGAVLGVGTLIATVPGLITTVKLAGAAFLFGFAALAARRAFRPQTAEVDDDTARTRRGLLATVATCLALTWLNPHLWVDVLMLGAISNSYAADRWTFAIGTMTASVVWFAALGFGARLLSPFFRSPKAWRRFDAGVAVVMASLAVGLLVTG